MSSSNRRGSGRADATPLTEPRQGAFTTPLARPTPDGAGVVSPRGLDAPAHGGQLDAAGARADDRLVAVLSHVSTRPLGERQRLLPGPRALQQAAARLGLGPGDRARAEQVAGAQAARRSRSGARRAARASRPAAARSSCDTSCAVELAARRRRRAPRPGASRRYGSGSRAGSAGCARGSAVPRHDPRRDRCRERLAQVRPERLGLPGLDVARAPVVQHDEPEEVLLGVARPATGSPCADGVPTTSPSSTSTSSHALGP